jgi:hypothetical protein
MRPIDPAYATHVLGINRTKWELAAMARALSFHPWLNSPDETERRRVAVWALRRWRAYQRACAAARDQRFRHSA